MSATYQVIPAVLARGGNLLCPVCQFDYVHHSTVVVYNRDKEDSHTGLVTDVGKSGTTTVRAHNMAGNPSARRDGIRIACECEEGHSFYLTVSQHKGQTYIETWEIPS